MLLTTEETEAQGTLRLDSSEQTQRRKLLSFLGNFEFKGERRSAPPPHKPLLWMLIQTPQLLHFAQFVYRSPSPFTPDSSDYKEMRKKMRDIPHLYHQTLQCLCHSIIIKTGTFSAGAMSLHLCKAHIQVLPMY